MLPDVDSGAFERSGSFGRVAVGAGLIVSALQSMVVGLAEAEQATNIIAMQHSWQNWRIRRIKLMLFTPFDGQVTTDNCQSSAENTADSAISWFGFS